MLSAPLQSLSPEFGSFKFVPLGNGLDAATWTRFYQRRGFQLDKYDITDAGAWYEMESIGQGTTSDTPIFLLDPDGVGIVYGTVLYVGAPGYGYEAYDTLTN